MFQSLEKFRNDPFLVTMSVYPTKFPNGLIFLVIYSKFVTFPHFRNICTFPPISEKITFPLFSLNYYTSPYVRSSYVFRLHFRFLASPILTIMYLYVMLYTYWTPLPTEMTV